MLDWLIIGGGVQGTTLAHFLTWQNRWPRDRVRVIDPEAALLASWRHCTRRVGMEFLRSTGVHHLDVPSASLEQFASTASGRPLKRFRGPYKRPALALFDAHCSHLIERHRLDSLHRSARATRIERRNGHWQVETCAGVLASRRVVLAVSAGDAPTWPAWAEELARVGGRVSHLFDPASASDETHAAGSVVVIGGGISAAQAALAFAARGCGEVTLISRHELRVRDFDSDPGWLGPRYLDGFRRNPCLASRRKQIAGARHRGSMPAEIARDLRSAAATRRIRLSRGEVKRASAVAGADVSLELDGGRGVLAATRVVLATGFSSARPGGALVEQVIEREHLATAGCGYPIVDRTLAWAPGLHVVGALAELELGPAARNIAGARMAANRIALAVG